MTMSASRRVFARGDVVYVPINFADFSARKVRPAVVVSTDRYNRQTPDLVIASITSNLRAIPHPGDHVIRDWQTAGLKAPSLAQAKVATVTSQLVRRKIGALSNPDLAALDHGLRQALGL